MSILGLILGGGAGSSMGVFTRQRSKPALPIGGKFRIIDFPLSSLVNSDITRIAVLTQYHPHSLIDHVGAGEPWGLGQHRLGGVEIWPPGIGRTGSDHYVGIADAVYQNRKFIREDGCSSVLIVSGDHLVAQDFRPMQAFHAGTGAGLTILAMPVLAEEAHNFGILSTDDAGRIISFNEKPDKPSGSLGSLGIYIFNTAFLLDLLDEDALDTTSAHDFGRNIIPRVVEAGRAYALKADGIWGFFGSVAAYWQFHMDLLDGKTSLGWDDPEWLIHTRAVDLPPAWLGPESIVRGSLIADGCVIDGEVTHSVLSPGVRVERGARVQNSVVFNDTVICAGAQVERAILDKAVEVGESATLGLGDDATPNQDQPELFNTGITAVGKWARIPAGAKVGRNVVIDLEVNEKDFKELCVPAGKTIRHL